MTDPRCDNCGAPAERIVDGIHWCVACSDAAGHVRCGQDECTWRCRGCGEYFEHDPHGSHPVHAADCGGLCRSCPVECGPVDRIGIGCGEWTASEETVAESPHRDAPRVRVCAACHERAARGETR